ncbi:MAG: metallopeptidase family protein [Planctomycetes bacterium]|nr:metallopeptidase family protein [Planctomycetota bacterium]
MKLRPDDFAALVKQALTDIPEPFRTYMHDIVVDIEPMPDARTCADMEVEDPTELLGLYLGTPLTDRGLESDAHLPDRIVIYQRNIEQMCETREEIVEEVRATVFHEVGHHFGLDEDDLAALGYD